MLHQPRNQCRRPDFHFITAKAACVCNLLTCTYSELVSVSVERKIAAAPALSVCFPMIGCEMEPLLTGLSSMVMIFVKSLLAVPRSMEKVRPAAMKIPNFSSPKCGTGVMIVPICISPDQKAIGVLLHVIVESPSSIL